jgi:hypothetical protein
MMLAYEADLDVIQRLGISTTPRTVASLPCPTIDHPEQKTPDEQPQISPSESFETPAEDAHDQTHQDRPNKILKRTGSDTRKFSQTKLVFRKENTSASDHENIIPVLLTNPNSRSTKEAKLSYYVP